MDVLFTALLIKRFLYLVVLASLSFFLYHVQENPNRYWIVLSAFFLSFIIFDETFLQKCKVILLTAIAVMLVVGMSSIWVNPFLLAIKLGILSAVCVLFMRHFPDYKASAWIVNLLGIVSAFQTTTLIEIPHRLLFIILGTGILLLCQGIFYWRPLKVNFFLNMYLALYHLRQLNAKIFEAFINEEYPNTLYLFERRIHLQKRAFLSYTNKVKKTLLPNGRGLLEHLNKCYALLLNCSRLRWQVKDKAMFKVCQIELIGMGYAINESIYILMQLFRKRLLFFGREPSFNDAQLAKKLIALEENYQNAIQVAANDPLIFFLFLDNLKIFIHDIESFYFTLAKWKKRE